MILQRIKLRDGIMNIKNSLWLTIMILIRIIVLAIKISYRIYVFDVSKQSETITNGIANVKIEFSYVTPIPVAANAAVTVYGMSLYDRIWSLKIDGIKQYIIKSNICYN